MTNLKKYSGLAGWLLLCFIAASIGAFFEPGLWYENLNKPSWTPPNWVFPIVWPILYAMMAISAWIVWKDYGFNQARQPIMWFGFQLILNSAWSWLFFGEHLIGTALAEILLLWIAILFTTMLFWKKSEPAGWLMVPYLLWVSYASALNFSLFQLN